MYGNGPSAICYLPSGKMNIEWWISCFATETGIRQACHVLLHFRLGYGKTVLNPRCADKEAFFKKFMDIWEICLSCTTSKSRDFKLKLMKDTFIDLCSFCFTYNSENIWSIKKCIMDEVKLSFQILVMAMINLFDILSIGYKTINIFKKICDLRNKKVGNIFVEEKVSLIGKNEENELIYFLCEKIMQQAKKAKEQMFKISVFDCVNTPSVFFFQSTKSELESFCKSISNSVNGYSPINMRDIREKRHDPRLRNNLLNDNASGFICCFTRKNKKDNRVQPRVNPKYFTIRKNAHLMFEQALFSMANKKTNPYSTKVFEAFCNNGTDFICELKKRRKLKREIGFFI